VLLLDETGKRLYFPVASQAASGRPEPARPEQLVFAADLGLAGWALQHGEAIAVDDVTSDPRFYAGVDQATGRETHGLLCAPLRTRDGLIGVVEVMNPIRGRFDAGDLPLLEAIAADVAIACVNARLYERLRGESLGLRTVCRIAGFGLVALAVAFGMGGLFTHLAQALPLSELLTRPSIATAAVLAVIGGALAAVSSGWIVPRAEARKPPEFYARRGVG
jgi:signal transduction protein with GAF and PtsI domain